MNDRQLGAARYREPRPLFAAIAVYVCLGGPTVEVWSAEPRADTQTPSFQVTAKNATDSVTWDGATTFDIASPRGIGGATITRSAGKWPERVVLRIRLRGLESLQVSDGKTVWATSVLSHSGNRQLATIVQNGKEKSVDSGNPHAMAVQAVNAKGEKVAGLPGDDGYFEVTLPAPLLKGQPERITISWIDFFRG